MLQQNIEVAYRAQAIRHRLESRAQAIHWLAPERGCLLQQTRHRTESAGGYPHLVNVLNVAFFRDHINEVVNSRELRAQGLYAEARERLSAQRHPLGFSHAILVALWLPRTRLYFHGELLSSPLSMR
jgi:hypothetical protein